MIGALHHMPESAFTIFPATWRDLSELRALEKACFDLDAWPLLDLLGVLTVPRVLRWKAVADGRMVGFAAADVHAAERTGWITTIGVLPQYRRQGVASALLDCCEGGLAVPRVRLCVRRSNDAAIRLYNQRGYSQVDIWAKYYIGGEDALVLEKML